MKKIYISLLFTLLVTLSFSQVNGDYQSTGNGNWTAIGSWEVLTAGVWLPATTYPGNTGGTYDVYIQVAHTITINTNVSTVNFGDLNINGTLNLNVPGNPDVISLNATSINIDAGNLNFTGSQVRLNLPTTSVITLDNGGTITADTCNNNNVIYLGTRKYAACAGGGSNTYTFGEVTASGGVINAQITNPATGPVTAQACTVQNLVGGYSGTEINVTYTWFIREPGATVNTQLSTGTLADNTMTTSESFTPNLIGSYLITLEISTASFTNIETRTFNSDDTQAPVPDVTNLPDVTGQCSATIPAAPTATDTCSGTITGTTSDALTRSTQGTSTVTWTFDDGNGNTMTQTQNIVVNDTTPPTAANPADINVQCLADVPAVNTNVVIGEADNCGSTLVSFVSQTADPAINDGTITRTYRVDDGNGNTIDVFQNIVINDTQNPVPNVANLPDVTGQCSATITTTPTATDTCGGTITGTTSDALTRSTQGTSTVTWTFDDGNGNTMTQTQNIVVNDTQNPVPNVTNLPDVTGQCSATIPAAPTATDTCGGTITGTTSDALTRSTQGTSTVTWTFDDGNGNTVTQTQDIVVNDTTNPTASNPADINVQCLADVPAVNTNVVIGEADNCGSTSVSFVSQTSDPAINDGTITRTYRVDDGNGNTTDVFQNIVINDTQNPVPNVTNLPDVTGQCSATIPAAPTATDTCGGTITGTTSDALTRSTQGTSTVTWTFDDGNGNTMTQTQNIVVNDTTPPTAANPADINVQCLADVPAANVAVVTDEADNCGSTTVTFISQTANPAVNDGTIIRTYRVDDGNGNTIDVFQNVVINDTQNPVPNVTNLPDVTGQCSATITTTPTATDTCGGTITGTTSDALTRSTQGTSTVTWTFDDGNGNTMTQTQNIVVNDTQNPVPNVTNLPDVTGQCSATIPAAPTATDTCGGTITGTTSDALTRSTQGTSTVTWTFDDGNGNTMTQTQNIVVNDTTPPTAANPADINVQCLADVPAVNTNVVIGEADNCGSTLVSFVSQTADPAINDGTITRTYRVDDGNGNTTDVFQNIVINDTQNPVPDVANLPDVTGQCSATITTTPTATDTCGGTITGTTSDALTRSTQGTSTVTWTFDDGNGQTVTQTQNIVVNDTQNPVPNVTNLPDVTGQCSATITTTPTATDTCGGTITGTTSDSLTRSTQGTSTVTWTFNDGNGQTVTQTQNIVVDDTTAPTASNPADINVQCLADIPAVNTNVVIGEADNCGTTSVSFVSQTADPAINDGTITRTYRVDDGNGNTIDVFQNIVINDTQNPVPNVTNLPDVTGQCSATIPAAPTATDTCGGTITGTTSDALTRSTQGTSTVTWTFDDGNGNTVTQTQNIVVNDTTAPTASNPAVVYVQCISDVPAANPNVVINEADNCGTTSVSFISQTANPSINNGTITRTFRVDDGNGNTTDVYETIVINDTQDPVISCPSPSPYVAAIGTCSASVNLSATVSDNCSLNNTLTYSIGGSIISFPYSFPIGSTTVNVVANDGNGNESTCNFNVVVIDNEDPTASNPATLTVSGTAPAPDITLVIDEADNCTANPTVSFVSDSYDGNSCPATLTRTYRVTDNAGNSIDVTQTIIVNDAVPPVARCISSPLTIVLDGVTGMASITPGQLDDGSSDNCGSISLSVSKDTFGCNDIGVNAVNLIVTDSQGNTATCAATVIVDAPTINGGSLQGYIMQTETAADAKTVVDVTSCPIDPLTGNTIQQDIALSLTVSPALASNINRWEYSTDGGVFWNSIANTTTSYTLMDIQVTTLVRAVFDVGDCQGFSEVAVLGVIPPDVPPTIVNGDVINRICLGETISAEAISEYGVNSAFNVGGMFNTANLNVIGWIVDGEQEMSAGGNNTNNTFWKLTNGPKNFNGYCFDTTDNSKFAIASGIPPYVNQTNNKHLITPLSTLETPIFSTYGLSDATLEFDEAYFFENGSWGHVEISVDGGANYNVLLYDHAGPANTTFLTPYPGFTGGGCNNSPGTMINNHIALDLQNYVGLTNLRIKFTYYGTANSVWALDNIEIPNAPINETIEWTDEFGVVVSTGTNVNIDPVTPGVQNYGATSLINNCRSDDASGTQFIKIEATLSYAGKNVAPLTGECGENTVQLAAYDNTKTAQQNYDAGVYNNNYKVPNQGSPSPDYPGTGEIGTWSVSVAPESCASGSYSFISENGLVPENDPNAIFTGEPGVYTLTWTVNGCASNVQVTLNGCTQVDFDGVNDYIDFKDNYDLTGPFSLEIWIKPEDLNGFQSLISKQDGNNLSAGYDLRLNGGNLIFNWGSGSISTNAVNANRWHHVAVTFSGSTYKIYVDGVEKNSSNGSSPSSNNLSFLVGAMDQSGAPPNKPINYYHGWVDELRIWNKALSEVHIRQMMNQEIDILGTDNVRGIVIPVQVNGPDNNLDGVDDDPLTWSNLDGYYRMDVGCGYLTNYKGSIQGRLRNIFSSQPQTAPLPYTTKQNGNWNTSSTWTQPNLWYIPNTTVNGTKIDWNIVRTSHNVTSNIQDLTLLGLDVESNTLTITNSGTQNENNTGTGLWITRYLKLDGTIDLIGESQLVQKRYSAAQFNESILDVTSSGSLERDQQGTTNLFNYNYWSSPVSTINTSNNNQPFNTSSIMRDGTATSNPQSMNWTSSYNATGSTNPITLSNRWLYAYENYPFDNYASWRYIGNNSTISPGYGFTMKGSGVGVGGEGGIITGGNQNNNPQNYVFQGKPNNGDITIPITSWYQALVGNPYPSAIDAFEFIDDNVPGGNTGSSSAIEGALYFWEHYTSNQTHILSEYQGGYAVLTKTGGVPVYVPTLISGAGTASKTPGRYIPVGQGFFVGNVFTTGGDIKFENDQRVFQREAIGNSVFMRSSAANTIDTTDDSDFVVSRVRINFTSHVDGKIRPLLLGFTSDDSATDGIDYGYDASNQYFQYNDAFWVIDNGVYVIQGVGHFNEDKTYPIGVYLYQESDIEFELTGLENFDQNNVKVYIYDSVEDTYTKINNNSFKLEGLAPDYYADRFFITFKPQAQTLSDGEKVLDTYPLSISYLNDSKEIFINTDNGANASKVQLISILGQVIQTWDTGLESYYTDAYRIPAANLTLGTYILKVKIDDEWHSKKVLVKN